MFNKTFFNKEIPKRVSYLDNVGYCINCGKLKSNENPIFDIPEAHLQSFLVLTLCGHIRKVEIDCECGCKVGMFDLDIEDYRVWNISNAQ